MKKKGRKAFWRNIKFKYKLTIINENTLEEVVGIHVSKLNGFSVLLATCTVIFLLAAIIIVFTPLRNYLPGYMNSEVRSQVVTNALKADSLADALERQNRYIMNIQDIFSGKVNVDTVQSIDSLTSIRTAELMGRSKEEDDFRRKYEERQKTELATGTEEHELSGLLFFRPTGDCSQGFLSGTPTLWSRYGGCHGRKYRGCYGWYGDAGGADARQGFPDSDSA